MLNGSDIFARLTSDATITALVGQRVYPQYVRQSDVAYPYLIYKRSSVATGQSYGGPTGLNSLDLEVAAIGKTQAQAEQAGNAAKASLDGDRGTWGSTVVQGCFLADDGESDEVVTEPESESVISYVKQLTFNVAFEG